MFYGIMRKIEIDYMFTCLTADDRIKRNKFQVDLGIHDDDVKQSETIAMNGRKLQHSYRRRVELWLLPHANFMNF